MVRTSRYKVQEYCKPKQHCPRSRLAWHSWVLHTPTASDTVVQMLTEHWPWRAKFWTIKQTLTKKPPLPVEELWHIPGQRGHCVPILKTKTFCRCCALQRHPSRLETFTMAGLTWADGGGGRREQGSRCGQGILAASGRLPSDPSCTFPSLE